MTPTMLLLPFALLMSLVWIAYRMDTREPAVPVPGPAERAMRSLKERLARGEISADDYSRLVALMR